MDNFKIQNNTTGSKSQSNILQKTKIWFTILVGLICTNITILFWNEKKNYDHRINIKRIEKDFDEEIIISSENQFKLLNTIKLNKCNTYTYPYDKNMEILLSGKNTDDRIVYHFPLDNKIGRLDNFIRDSVQCTSLTFHEMDHVFERYFRKKYIMKKDTPILLVIENLPVTSKKEFEPFATKLLRMIERRMEKFPDITHTLITSSDPYSEELLKQIFGPNRFYKNSYPLVSSKTTQQKTLQVTEATESFIHNLRANATYNGDICLTPPLMDLCTECQKKNSVLFTEQNSGIANLGAPRTLQETKSKIYGKNLINHRTRLHMTRPRCRKMRPGSKNLFFLIAMAFLFNNKN
uniref:Uncharacterized protein n=1 Tax=Mimivirus LCMiAC01 TaxID=2506608 RepID=A0A481Z1S4_9VIRU|nr:MAG: hypothetical protein LCMiAC01_04020 [Mimivirus LCMiAC01]